MWAKFSGRHLPDDLPLKGCLGLTVIHCRRCSTLDKACAHCCRGGTLTGPNDPFYLRVELETALDSLCNALLFVQIYSISAILTVLYSILRVIPSSPVQVMAVGNLLLTSVISKVSTLGREPGDICLKVSTNTHGC